jgi:hypothetical protein
MPSPAYNNADYTLRNKGVSEKPIGHKYAIPQKVLNRDMKNP